MEDAFLAMTREIKNGLPSEKKEGTGGPIDLGKAEKGGGGAGKKPAKSGGMCALL